MKFSFSRIAAAATAIVAASQPALAQTAETGRQFYHHGPGMIWDRGPWGGYGMMFGPLFSLLVLIAIIALVIYFLRVFGFAPHLHGPHKTANNALDILKERYARGEIDSKEFDERKRMLSE
jgi:putative membrane protein